jgi:hypothetical protein
LPSHLLYALAYPENLRLLAFRSEADAKSAEISRTTACLPHRFNDS